MKVEKLDHIHIYVRDISKAAKFFSEALGCEFSDVMVVDRMKTRSVVDLMGLDLVESTSPEGVVAQFIERRGEGLGGLSFKVQNLDEAIKEMQSHGIRMIGQAKVGRLREAYFHPKDCFGVMIELCEYRAEHGSAIASLSR